MRRGLRWVGAVLAMLALASPCDATSRRLQLDHAIRKHEPMAIIRVVRVERLAGVRMALARVEAPFIGLQKDTLVAFQAQPVSEWSSSHSAIRGGDRLWLERGLGWPTDAFAGLRIPSADAVRDEVSRRWGSKVPLYDANTRQLWRFGGAEWVSDPNLGMPPAVRSRKRGERTWFHLGDMERYVRKGLIEDPTLVRLVEGSRIVASGTMVRKDGGWVELRIEKIIAARQDATAMEAGDTLRVQEHPLWGYDVRYGAPMLWFLQYRSGGFGFTAMADKEKVLPILRRRKGWRELK